MEGTEVVKVAAWLMSAIATFLFVIGINVGGVALHLYTVLVCLEAWGVMAAMGALVMPFIAEIICFFVFWAKMGSLMNPYSFYVLLWLLLLAVTLVLHSIAKAMEPRSGRAR